MPLLLELFLGPLDLLLLDADPLLQLLPLGLVSPRRVLSALVHLLHHLLLLVLSVLQRLLPHLDQVQVLIIVQHLLQLGQSKLVEGVVFEQGRGVRGRGRMGGGWLGDRVVVVGGGGCCKDRVGV